MTGKTLGTPFNDMVELRWRQFKELEEQGDLSNVDITLTTLVRHCADSNLKAIKLALERLDGRMPEVKRIIPPKFYYLYPNAKKSLGPPRAAGSSPQSSQPAAPVDSSDEELPTGSVRAVLAKLMDERRSVTQAILDTAKKVDEGEPVYDEAGNPSDGPYVKSVMAAGFMRLVHNGSLKAVTELFNQIDGKVAQEIQLLGGDVYVTRYDEVAPKGSYLNENGIYELEGESMTETWVERLEDGQR